jgi:hypothetical protein
VIRIVRECCRQLTVLHIGAKFAEGPTTAVLAGKDVAAIYLGTAHSRVHAQKTDDRPAPGEATPLLSFPKISSGQGLAY